MKAIRMCVWCGLCAAALVAVLIGLARNDQKQTVHGSAPPEPWSKIEPHLNQLDQASAEVAEKHLQRIREFFASKKTKGTKEFADWAFGWTAKYYLVKGKLQGDDSAGFRQWLEQKFEENVFKAEDLQAVLTSVIEGYVTEMQGAENETLVQIRADIAQDELFQGKLPELQSDEAFKLEYRRLAEGVLPKVLDDLKIGLVGQITNLALSEVAARALTPGLLARLGISGSGWAGSLVRFGGFIAVGTAAVWAIDKLIDWLLDLFGYGPAAELAGNVDRALGRLEAQLIDGDPAATANYQRLREQERDASTPEDEQRFQQAADAIQQSGALGLRREFQSLQELQSKLRRAALLKMVSAQGGN